MKQETTFESPATENPVASTFPWIKSYPEGMRWDADLTPCAVHNFLENSANKYPDNVCTWFLGKTLTYEQINRQADRVAKGLQLKGVKKGDRVGIFLPNTPTFIIFYYAILKIGGTVVNFNPLYTVEELKFQVTDSNTDIMVTLDLEILYDKVEALLQLGVLKNAVICPFTELLPGVKSTLFKLLKRKELANTAASTEARKLISLKDLTDNDGRYQKVSTNVREDIALLQYTGGTTGVPKGAMLTHANLSINILQKKLWAPELEEGREIIMGILPLFHVFAMTTVMNYGIATAAELILIPKFELKSGLKIIDKKKPTLMPGVPTLYTAMINCPTLKKYDLSSLKFCISGGAPLPVEIKSKFEQLAGCKLVEGYGLSETAPVATCNLTAGDVREGSIGVPFPNTIVSIRSLEDPAVEMPQGERGEICIYGPQVMKGYWNKPQETENVFVGEFLRTGDVGYIDQDGYIYIVDRLKDLILCSGFNVYPRQVEEAIYQYPGVEEVIVIGIPDDYRGEAPKAYVKMQDGAEQNAEAMLEFLKEKLSKIEMPSEIEFRDELPKTMIGKLSKKELREEGEQDAA